MPTKPCVGCGWCCLTDQCMESHRKHGYLPRCPEIVWDVENVRYNCRLMQDPVSGGASRKALLQGKGCCAPLNPWRDHVRNRDPLPAVRIDLSPALIPVTKPSHETFQEIHMKHCIATPDAPKAIGPYSQAVRTGNLLFLSGQLPLDPQTMQFVPGGITEQTRQVLTNARAVLRAAGSDLEQVVKATVLLKDMNDFAAMNGVYGEFFTADHPARSTFQVAKLPLDALVEIELIAEIQE